MKKCLNCGKVKERGRVSNIITANVNRTYAGNDMAQRSVYLSTRSDFVNYRIFICDDCSRIRNFEIGALLLILIPITIGSIVLIALTNSPVFCAASAIFIIPLGIALVMTFNRKYGLEKIMERRNQQSGGGNYEVIDPASRFMKENPGIVIRDEALDDPGEEIGGQGAIEAQGEAAVASGSNNKIWIAALIIFGIVILCCLCLTILLIVITARDPQFLNTIFPK
jgi:hypothetical protein